MEQIITSNEKFDELVAVLSTEELIRIRRRLQLACNLGLARILSDEIAERDALEALKESFTR